MTRHTTISLSDEVYDDVRAAVNDGLNFSNWVSDVWIIERMSLNAKRQKVMDVEKRISELDGVRERLVKECEKIRVREDEFIIKVRDLGTDARKFLSDVPKLRDSGYKNTALHKRFITTTKVVISIEEFNKAVRIINNT